MFLTTVEWTSVLLGLSLSILLLIGSTASTPYGFPRIGPSRLWTLVTWKKPARFDLPRYAQIGYEKVNKALGKPFITKVFGHDYVVLPSKYLDDIKRASPKSLSFFQALSDGLNMEASVGHLYASTTEIDVVVKHLNPRLTKLTPLLFDEAEYAIRKEIGPATEWKSFNVSNLIGAIVHRTGNRILVGPELCRDEAYLAATTRFSRSLFLHGIFWNFVRLGPFRKLIARLTIGLHLRDRDAAARMLLPHIHSRRQEKASGVDVAAKYPDALQWTLETPSSFPGDDDPLHQAYQMLHLTFAASSASGVGVTQCLLNVLAYPEYLGPLREEIKTVVARHSGWTDKALSQMALLDSFIRETMRLHPAGSLTVARTVMDDQFRFHDGLTLPKGANIIAPALAIHHDPENYTDGSKFDGFRFARYRQKQGDSHRWLASTIDPKFLQFGYGNHACPGRFYAIRKIKLVLGKLLMDYEFQWATPRSVNSRPEDLAIEAQLMVAPDTEVLIRSCRA
ncbi:cytochrome P450 [Aspergillus clavatus NRRL 1]|uniref:Cytochrome P450 monooxygenase, putative n=1 Tax=Aspergillus clavatus (strain ATCC 1007 / CBS 513.65 / DSM 816 / NCTC 3887 / NRRL 1 / QM 1276 / 107) TaxID=344612 RepID=A1CGG3_ASPCL|nr:cytochrome P450 monooxygenase, putative [Aspergillus clavatus NRRL 1]EAW11043.1 cytochrome P450 monooxygenase, putative [Aspergillus clavatus NRRL 1]